MLARIVPIRCAYPSRRRPYRLPSRSLVLAVAMPSAPYLHNLLREEGFFLQTQRRTKVATTNTFDFTAYNEMMSKANSGLQLYLAIQSLQTVEAAYRRYKNPLASDLIDLVDELQDLRARGKKMAEAREKSSDGRIDNETTPDGKGPTTSTDTKDVYNRVGEAKLAGHI